MHYPTLRIFLFSLSLSIASLFGDTIKLKDGTILEGKILEQSQTVLKLEYNITKSIKDVKTINTADISLIDKETEDEIAFTEIKALLPSADLLTTDDYNKILAEKPAKFIKKYPASKLKDSVQKVIDKLESEKAVTESGGVKIDGEWITGEEAAKDPYNHSARIIGAKITSAIANRKYTAALEHFGNLEIERPYSVTYSTAIPTIQQVLPKYDAMLNQIEKTYPAIIAERTEQLKSMEPEDKKRTEAAFDVGLKTFQSRREAAKELKKTWLPVNKWDLKSIKEAREIIVKETKKFSTFDLTSASSTAKVLSEAFVSLADGKLEVAQTQLNTAKSSGVRGDIIDQLTKDLETAQYAEAEAKKAAAIAATAIKKTEENETESSRGVNPDKNSRNNRTSIPKTVKKSSDKSKAENTTSSKKTGINFQTIIIILAVILAGITVYAKIFLKPPTKEEN